MMNTENKELTTNISNERLNSFFNETIDGSTMAKYIRRVNYILALTAIRQNNDNPIDKEWLDDGYYWLNELAEVLDPNINIE